MTRTRAASARDARIDPGGRPAARPDTRQQHRADSAEHGDDKLYTALLAAAERAARQTAAAVLHAAADFRDPALVDRGLRRAISSDVGRRMRALSRGVLHESGRRPRAWAFVTANWTALEPKLTIFNGRRGSSSTRWARFCDTGTRDSIVTSSRRIHCKAPRARSIRQSSASTTASTTRQANESRRRLARRPALGAAPVVSRISRSHGEHEEHEVSRSRTLRDLRVS